MEPRHREVGVSEPNPREWALVRLTEELGANEAARVVGYKSGRPSAACRELWACIEAAQELPEICKAVPGEKQRLKQEIAKARERLRSLEAKLLQQDRWEEACEVLADTRGVVSA